MNRSADCCILIATAAPTPIMMQQKNPPSITTLHLNCVLYSQRYPSVDCFPCRGWLLCDIASIMRRMILQFTIKNSANEGSGMSSQLSLSIITKFPRHAPAGSVGAHLPQIPLWSDDVYWFHLVACTVTSRWNVGDVLCAKDNLTMDTQQARMRVGEEMMTGGRKRVRKWCWEGENRGQSVMVLTKQTGFWVRGAVMWFATTYPCKWTVRKSASRSRATVHVLYVPICTFELDKSGYFYVIDTPFHRIWAKLAIY